MGLFRYEHFRFSEINKFFKSLSLTLCNFFFHQNLNQLLFFVKRLQGGPDFKGKGNFHGKGKGKDKGYGKGKPMQGYGKGYDSTLLFLK